MICRRERRGYVRLGKFFQFCFFSRFWGFSITEVLNRKKRGGTRSLVDNCMFLWVLKWVKRNYVMGLGGGLGQ